MAKHDKPLLDDELDDLDDGEDLDLDDDWADDEDADDEDGDDDRDEDDLRPASEADFQPWQPQAGVAADPYADRPQDRERALQPLLERGGRQLTASSLRFLRGSGDEKLDLLLGLPEPKRAVQAMAPEEFVLLVKDIGLSDCADLLALASGRQLQAALDLDAWQTGELDVAAVSEWLLTAEDAGKSVLERFVAAQDDGLLSAYIGRAVRVFLVAEEEIEAEIPDDAEVFLSPDEAFQLVGSADDANLPAVRQLIAAVWRQSPARGRALLLATRWELPTQLEEDVYQLRNGRLEEIGFIDREEALQLYAYRNPHAWRDELHARYRGTQPASASSAQPYLPATEAPRLGLALRAVEDGGFLGRVLALLPDADVARLRLALVRLGYAVQSARATRPSAVDELARWSRHGLQTASMGLEFLADGDVAYGTLLATVVSAKELFSAGHSLVVLQGQRARRLRRELGDSTALERLEPRDAQLLRGLTHAFAERPEGDTFTPVASLGELDLVARQLSAIAAVVRMAQTLSGGDLATTAPLGLRALVGTAIAWQVVSGQPHLDPLDRATFQAFLTQGMEGPRGQRIVRRDLRQALVRSLLARPDLSDDDVTALGAFLEATLDRLGEELGGLDPQNPIDLRYVGDSLRLADDE